MKLTNTTEKGWTWGKLLRFLFQSNQHRKKTTKKGSKVDEEGEWIGRRWEVEWMKKGGGVDEEGWWGG